VAGALHRPHRPGRSKTFRRKVDAAMYLIHIEAQKQRSEWINPEISSTLFEDWAEGWLANRTHLKPTTFSGYESLLRVHILPRFGSSRLDRIDSLSIEDWIADLKTSGLSPLGSVRHTTFSLRFSRRLCALGICRRTRRRGSTFHASHDASSASSLQAKSIGWHTRSRRSIGLLSTSSPTEP
jgi:hypothetical protein